MRFEIVAGVFADPEHLSDVLALLRMFVYDRHEWEVDEEVIEVSDAYFREHLSDKARQRYEGLARKRYTSQFWARRSRNRPLVTITPEALSEQVDELSRPARLVVEHHYGDGCFIRAVATVFDEKLIIEAEARGWLEFAHGGGSDDVVTVAKKEKSRFTKIARVGALFDSDRMTPEQVPDCHNKAQDLTSEGILVHVLAFREAENYVPDGVVRAMKPPPTPEKLAFLGQLTWEQRAHFDMKKGFRVRGENRAAIKPEQVELFADLSQEAIDGLMTGFGRGLMPLLVQEAKNGKIQVADFEALGPGVRKELRALLDLVLQIV